jgi:tocopherol O-methyltransferase
MTKQHNKVLAYYKSTNFDYEHFWAGKRALALHFGYYDSTVSSHEESLLRMNQVLAEYAHIKETDTVLDAGCGYGGSSIWLAENIGCNVVGATIVPYQVQKAKLAASKSKSRNRLKFINADYADTKLPGASFDVIWGLESIVHCDDKAAFVKEAYRLLKPGGRLIISEYMLRQKPKLTESESEILDPFLKGWMMPDLLTLEQYRKYSESAGFYLFKTYDLSGNVDKSLRKCRRNASLALPFVGTLQKLHMIDKIRRDYTIANYVLYDSFKQGLWSYRVVVATKQK